MTRNGMDVIRCAYPGRDDMMLAGQGTAGTAIAGFHDDCLIERGMASCRLVPDSTGATCSEGVGLRFYKR